MEVHKLFVGGNIQQKERIVSIKPSQNFYVRQVDEDLLLNISLVISDNKK